MIVPSLAAFSKASLLHANFTSSKWADVPTELRVGSNLYRRPQPQVVQLRHIQPIYRLHTGYIQAEHRLYKYLYSLYRRSYTGHTGNHMACTTWGCGSYTGHTGHTAYPQDGIDLDTVWVPEGTQRAIIAIVVQ